MDTAESLQLVLLVVSAIIAVALLVFAVRNWREPLAPYFAATFVCLIVWSVGSAMEVSSTTLAGHLFWTDFQFFGYVPIAAFWFFTMRRIMGAPRLPALLTTAIWGFCIAILLGVLFNPGYVHRDPSAFVVRGDGAVTIQDLGPLYLYAVTPYTSLLLVGCAIMLLHSARTRSGTYRRRVTTLAVVTLVPVIAAALFVAGALPWAEYDPSMAEVTLVTAVCGFVVWHYRLLGLAPLAHGTVIEHLADGVIVLNDDHQIVDANPSARAIFPNLTRAMMGESLKIALAPYPDVADAVEVVTTTGSDTSQLPRHGCCDENEAVGSRTHGGSFITVNVADAGSRQGCDKHFSVAKTEIHDRAGRNLGTAIVFHDVTRNVDLMNQIKRLADTDSLTGCLTRRRFLELAGQEIARARRKDLPLSMLLLDLDNFKEINDRYGHAAGDEVLRVVATACRAELRSLDLVGRYGGDEFCVLMPHVRPDEAEGIAQRLCRSVAALVVRFNGDQIRTTISIGVAGAVTIGEHSVVSMLADADKALYTAKRGGRDRMSSFAG
ncbi:MAG: diguanylate cyclase [Thermoleophilia bacterium]